MHRRYLGEEYIAALEVAVDEILSVQKRQAANHVQGNELSAIPPGYGWGDVSHQGMP